LTVWPADQLHAAEKRGNASLFFACATPRADKTAGIVDHAMINVGFMRAKVQCAQTIQQEQP
jgi:hypothetical protein